MKTRNALGAGFFSIAWLTTAAALLVHPSGSAHKGTQLLAMANDHHDQLIAFGVLYLVSAILFIPAMVLVSNVAVERGRKLMLIACILVLIGAVGHAAESTMNMLLTAIASIPADTAAKAKVLDDSTGLIAPVLALAVLFDLALVVFAVAAWRARLTSFWPAVLIGAAVVVGNFAPNELPFQAVGIGLITVAVVMIAVGLAGYGRSTASVETARNSARAAV